MKKFKFRLEGLKKLREFNEHRVKIELGHINQEIQRLKDEIIKHNNDLSISYDSQNELVKSGIKAKMLQFYPFFNKGKRAHIEKLENELFSWEKQHKEKLQELHEKRGETKIISKLKEKEKNEFKKEMMKKEEVEKQDLFIISRGSRKGEF